MRYNAKDHAQNTGIKHFFTTQSPRSARATKVKRPARYDNNAEDELLAHHDALSHKSKRSPLKKALYALAEPLWTP